MVTSVQSRAFRKGTLAAMERESERETTYIAVTHSPQVQDQQIVTFVEQTLAAAGAGRITVQMSEDAAVRRAAYEQSQQVCKQQAKKIQAQQEEIEALTQGQGQVDTREWIGLQEFADRINEEYITLWRAHKAHRLMTKDSGKQGRKKYDRILCDPTTYIPATRGRKRKSQ